MQPRRELFAVLSIACNRACVWVEGARSVSVPSEEGGASSVGAGRVEASLTNSWRICILECARRERTKESLTLSDGVVYSIEQSNLSL